MDGLDSAGIVIVGGGHAAAELAMGLRAEGYAGRVLVIGEEHSLPYQRPPLSKAYLSAEVGLEELHVRSQAAYEKAGIDFLLGNRVVAIDRDTRRVTLGTGSEVAYDKLALVTGGRARRVDLPGSDLAGIFYLRTHGDVEAIRKKMHPGQRLVIVGGGYVGLEVAAVAVRAGLHVTVLEAETRVLARVTAPEISRFYEAVHREEKVDIRTQVKVEGFAANASGDHVAAVQCNDGSKLEADLVIVGVGLVPNVELAESAGIAVDNGIIVDEFGRTNDANIVAAGDCANHPSFLYKRRLRLESVPNAVEQARTAAATLCDKEKPYQALPWFWSEQYDLKLQMAGLSQGYDSMVIRGSLEQRSFTAFYLKGERIISADSVNRPGEFMVAKKLIVGGFQLSPEDLANDSIPLKTLLPI